MKNKLIKIFIVFIMAIFLTQCYCLAATDQARLFMASDCEEAIALQTLSYVASTYQKLGYNIVDASPYYTITNSRSEVLNYISNSGNNYAFFVLCHGGSSVFGMESGNTSSYIYPSDISGNWNFVFLNSCSCLATDTFARAFKTVGYSNRACLGWFDSVSNVGSEEWWRHFKDVAGTTDLRTACLFAADQCSYYTPIRIYGDKTWNGYAW